MSKAGKFIQLDIHEGAESVDSTTPAIKADIREYEVTAESGLLKRGKHWPKGSKIELERKSALNFINVGEVKEIVK